MSNRTRVKRPKDLIVVVYKGRLIELWNLLNKRIPHQSWSVDQDYIEKLKGELSNPIKRSKAIEALVFLNGFIDFEMNGSCKQLEELGRTPPVQMKKSINQSRYASRSDALNRSEIETLDEDSLKESMSLGDAYSAAKQNRKNLRKEKR
ncbi:MAG: hypothetical protein IPK04_14715 [Bdellovibrionales bacterium]|nr:hypothetical protein [Bdellovibrionales bacterium]